MKTNVFIVEDSLMFSTWLKSELKKNEQLNLIGIAGSVQQGLNSILKFKPQIVILDLFLEDGSGFKILQTIRELELPIKVIVFTNFNYYRNECKKLGCDYFFDKSKEFEELISTLKLLCKYNINENSESNNSTEDD